MLSEIINNKLSSLDLPSSSDIDRLKSAKHVMYMFSQYRHELSGLESQALSGLGFYGESDVYKLDNRVRIKRKLALDSVKRDPEAFFEKLLTLLEESE